VALIQRCADNGTGADTRAFVARIRLRALVLIVARRAVLGLDCLADANHTAGSLAARKTRDLAVALCVHYALLCFDFGFRRVAIRFVHDLNIRHIAIWFVHDLNIRHIAIRFGRDFSIRHIAIRFGRDFSVCRVAVRFAHDLGVWHIAIRFGRDFSIRHIAIRCGGAIPIRDRVLRDVGHVQGIIGNL